MLIFLNQTALDVNMDFVIEYPYCRFWLAAHARYHSFLWIAWLMTKFFCHLKYKLAPECICYLRSSYIGMDDASSLTKRAQRQRIIIVHKTFPTRDHESYVLNK